MAGEKPSDLSCSDTAMTISNMEDVIQKEYSTVVAGLIQNDVHIGIRGRKSCQVGVMTLPIFGWRLAKAKWHGRTLGGPIPGGNYLTIRAPTIFSSGQLKTKS